MSSRLVVAVANLQEVHPVDAKQLKAAVRKVLAEAGFERGEISIAVVDDQRMHELNRQYLQHDYPTDVLSFVLEEDDDSLEGEIIVSADYASREAARFGWETKDELLLYVIHGSLHLVGYDDQTPEAKREMRQAEQRFLALFGKTPRYDEE
jgi:probable rRNA maturation factor